MSRPRFALTFSLVLAAAAARAGDVRVQLDSGSGFSVKNGTGAIERLRVDEATGNVSRNGALFVHTTGWDNLFVGPGAGNTSTINANSNTGVGHNALLSITGGSLNSAFGRNALRSNTSGVSNSAFGFGALYANTTGNGNSAFGERSLRYNTTGTRNTAVGGGAMLSNTTGYFNTAVGHYALMRNTTGWFNTAVGHGALAKSTIANGNSAFGDAALAGNATGHANVAMGAAALMYNTAPSNSAVGWAALLLNTTGSYNTALGRGALYSNSTGSRNIAIGADAGDGQTTGSDNIYINASGVTGENGQIRIGDLGEQTGAHVAGIHGATSSGGIAVLVNAAGTLGTATSSARFKRDVEDLGDASDLLMRLRPVRFHYLEEAVGAEEAKTTQYGLIAEEVAQVAPELVAPDAEGKPYSVKYHVLPALLLSELQAQRRINDEQRRVIATLTDRIDRLESH